MANTWESARSETMKTCGPEINAEGSLRDTSTSGAFDKAKLHIEKNTGLFETKSGQLDKYGAKIRDAIKTGGANACGDIAKVLEDTSFKKGIPENIGMAKIPENTPGIKNTSKESFPSIQSTAKILGSRAAVIDAASGG